MTTLDIELLRAHYHDVDPIRLPLLDAALRELADHGLEDELAGRDIAGVLASSWAVCIDELVVAFDLDPTRPTVAASWAHAILEALTGAVDRAVGVVVYRREAEALIDLVTAIARSDLSRLWAWRQVGLVVPRVLRPTPADVAAVALARPSLIPVVLAAAGPACRAIFGVDDWVRFAHAVARHVGSPPWSARDAEPGQTDGVGGWATPTPSADAVTRPARRSSMVNTWATVPAQVWGSVTDSRDRWSLAVLCQAVAGSHLVRDRSAIEAVVDEAPAPHRSRVAAPGSETPESVARPQEPSDPGQFDSDAVTSAWGGVWFLTHALLELGVIDGLSAGPVGAHQALHALEAIVVAVTGAPADDPSVSGLRGSSGDDARTWTPTPVQEQEAARWAASITAWLGERANGRLAARLVEPSAGGRSLWRRVVTIETSPGRIEITSLFTDVDLDIRMAGLDIDPGFVWWLGAVVEFRYV